MASGSEQGGHESRIGKGTRISGTLSFGAPVRIDGEVEGELSGDEITISEGAAVNAKLTATRLTVAGRLEGEAAVRDRIELLATARVECRLTTPSLVLREGAQFNGDCKLPASARPVQAAVAPVPLQTAPSPS